MPAGALACSPGSMSATTRPPARGTSASSVVSPLLASETEAVWEFAEHRCLYIEENVEHAGPHGHPRVTRWPERSIR